jgi:hypothetical protein
VVDSYDGIDHPSSPNSSAFGQLTLRVDSLAMALPGELEQTATAAGLKGRVVLVDCPEW